MNNSIRYSILLAAIIHSHFSMAQRMIRSKFNIIRAAKLFSQGSNLTPREN